MISESTVQALRVFLDERGWAQYNTVDALAKSICIEAGELLECFQWSPDVEKPDLEHVKEELADVLIYCSSMADALGCSMEDIILSKLAKNRAKYPVQAVRGDFAGYRRLHDGKAKDGSSQD
ncbi:nucleotide pyrophosphohydrolase [Bifidobacterium bombi]|uniref:MazG nucleotide pyrophosphohydrolase n=1 Tax=Bifidobacterium bombi DSM 19703 TaxID=1341695 RepID=A0A086BNF4_9BIFI|nr:nucleotide pyrophosphohydrolase [Bifidobacterium bombi]KFF30468.1 MazG nucleotide pyrophosphohydrolase [Bifidobacterium bombi DSM 19703]